MDEGRGQRLVRRLGRSSGAGLLRALFRYVGRGLAVLGSSCAIELTGWYPMPPGRPEPAALPARAPATSGQGHPPARPDFLLYEPPPAHPERLRPDIPPSALERDLWARLGRLDLGL